MLTTSFPLTHSSAPDRTGQAICSCTTRAHGRFAYAATKPTSATLVAMVSDESRTRRVRLKRTCCSNSSLLTATPSISLAIRATSISSCEGGVSSSSRRICFSWLLLCSVMHDEATTTASSWTTVATVLGAGTEVMARTAKERGGQRGVAFLAIARTRNSAIGTSYTSHYVKMLSRALCEFALLRVHRVDSSHSVVTPSSSTDLPPEDPRLLPVLAAARCCSLLAARDEHAAQVVASAKRTPLHTIPALTSPPRGTDECAQKPSSAGRLLLLARQHTRTVRAMP